MFTPWRSAALYAGIVTVGSAAVSGLMESALMLLSGMAPAPGEMLLFSPHQAAVLPMAFVALTLTRKLRPALPRWQVVVTDSTVYTLAFLLASAAVSLAYDGAREAAEVPFALASLAMITLQIPSAYVLSGWASGRLTVAMRVPRLPRSTPGSALHPEG
ncbi:hypothetical protein ACWD4G_12220 [Streptomyces sp. NPDC002643]